MEPDDQTDTAGGVRNGLHDPALNSLGTAIPATESGVGIEGIVAPDLPIVHRSSSEADRVFGRISLYRIYGKGVNEKGQRRTINGEIHLPSSISGQAPFIYPLIGQLMMRNLVDGVLFRRESVVMLVLTERKTKGTPYMQWMGNISKDGRWSGIYHKLWTPGKDETPKESPAYGHFKCKLVPSSDGKSIPFNIVMPPSGAMLESAREDPATNVEEEIGKDEEDETDSEDFQFGNPEINIQRDIEVKEASARTANQNIGPKDENSEIEEPVFEDPNDDALFAFDEELSSRPQHQQIARQTNPAPEETADSKDSPVETTVYFGSRSLPVQIQLPVHRKKWKTNDAGEQDGQKRGGNIEAENHVRKDFVAPHTLAQNDFWSFANNLKFPKTARAFRAASKKKSRTRSPMIMDGSLGRIDKEDVKNSYRDPPAVSLLSQSFMDKPSFLLGRSNDNSEKLAETVSR
mmetsp:Transcript_4184/g.9803  ORF Transcript_4184/g.9803 Transcript_4184/m.9803 type:complete len:461 (-) Transcript_4184:87-1469(-)